MLTLLLLDSLFHHHWLVMQPQLVQNRLLHLQILLLPDSWVAVADEFHHHHLRDLVSPSCGTFRTRSQMAMAVHWLIGLCRQSLRRLRE
jgi:hypothetical protein